jgi:hypothetical protein
MKLQSGPTGGRIQTQGKEGNRELALEARTRIGGGRGQEADRPSIAPKELRTARPRRCNVHVDLGGEHVSQALMLLNRANVRSAIEQMRGERVASVWQLAGLWMPAANARTSGASTSPHPWPGVLGRNLSG